MNFNRILQPLLIALLVIGVFAAMAKNAYGFTFMAVACFGLAFLYVAQLVWKVIDDYSNINRKNLSAVVEPFLVAALLLLFSLRASYIYLANGEVIFLATCGLLVLVYLAIAVGIIRNINKESIVFGLYFNKHFTVKNKSALKLRERHMRCNRADIKIDIER